MSMPPAALPLSNTEHMSDTSLLTPYLNDASKVLPFHVETHCSHPDRDQQLIHVATTLCPSLTQQNDSPKQLTVESLSGGLSNVLFVVRSAQGRSVLVRIHSRFLTEVERDDENRMLAWLSKRGIAPTFYGRFHNGRVEEFFQGYFPLSFKDMHLYHAQIASLLSSLHSSTVPESVLPRTNTAQCWKNIQTWFKLAKQQQQQQQDSLDLDYIEKEAKWLQRQLNLGPSDSALVSWCRQLVFTHNDAQSLNILRNSHGNIKLIDYEYAGWNPRVLDLANTFLEYCDMNNLNADYVTQYPSENQQDEFLRAYMHHDKSFSFENTNHLQQMKQEIGKHTLISHLHWAIWSIVQAPVSDIDFDYIAYAKQRMEGYTLMKNKYF